MKLLKVTSFKLWIKLMDLLITLFAFTECVIAQIENENLYNSNLTYRSKQINVINFMRSNHISNIQKSSDIINSSTYLELYATFNVSPEYILQYANYQTIEIDLIISNTG